MGAVGICDDGKTAYGGDVGWWLMNGATGCSDFSGVFVDVIGADVADPGGRRTGSPGHQAGHAGFAYLEDGVFHAWHAHVFGGPSDDGGVKGLGSGHVGGHELVPEEFSVEI